jgi:hypothetical protein
VAGGEAHYTAKHIWEPFNAFPSNHYLRLRLCINHAIFIFEHNKDYKRAFAITAGLIRADSPNKLKRQPTIQPTLGSPDMTDIQSIGRWPVYESEIGRLRKKVLDLREQYAQLVTN